MQTPQLLFWNNWKKKSWSIFFIVVAVFVLTLPWSLYSMLLYPILLFPTGLIGLVSDYNKYVILIFPLWAIYLGLATTIVLTNKKTVVRGAYIILIFLLVLNVVGCQIIAPSEMSAAFS